VSYVGIDPQHPAAQHAQFRLDLIWRVEAPVHWHAAVIEGLNTFYFTSPLAFLEWLEHRTLSEREIGVDLP
jgi:hypothetical protein